MSESEPKAAWLFVVYGALLVLLIATVSIAEVNLGRWNFVAAFVIALLKATLIVLYFMHVRHNSGLTKLAAVTGFCWLGIMFALSFSDFLTRGWIPVR